MEEAKRVQDLLSARGRVEMGAELSFGVGMGRGRGFGGAEGALGASNAGRDGEGKLRHAAVRA